MPSHVRGWGDVGAAHAGNRPVGQIVVEQDEVRNDAVHRQDLVLIQIDFVEHQRSGDAGYGSQSVQIGRTNRAFVPRLFNDGFDRGNVFDITLVACVALREDVDPDAIRLGALHVIFEQV